MKTYKEIIDQKLDEAHNIINSFPRGTMGLSTEETRNNPVYIQAKKDWAIWFEELRKYNKQFLKAHKLVGYELINGKRVAIYKLKKQII